MNIPKIFKPEMFCGGSNFVYGWAEDSANEAQEIFEKYVKEHGTVVCGTDDPRAAWTQKAGTVDTHQAVLLFIQPTEKCEHIAALEKVRDGPWNIGPFVCVKCGKRLRPVAWEEVE